MSTVESSSHKSMPTRRGGTVAVATDAVLVAAGVAACLWPLTGQTTVAPWQLALGLILASMVASLAFLLWPRPVGILAVCIGGVVFTGSAALLLYTAGLPQFLPPVWGAAVLSTTSIARLRPPRSVRPSQLALRRGVLLLGLAVAFFLYTVAAWPPWARSVLLDLPIPTTARRVETARAPGGVWVGIWELQGGDSAQVRDDLRRRLASEGWSVGRPDDLSAGVTGFEADRPGYVVQMIYYQDAGGEMRTPPAAAKNSLEAYAKWVGPWDMGSLGILVYQAATIVMLGLTGAVLLFGTLSASKARVGHPPAQEG